MNNIQIKGVDTILGQVVLEDIQDLKHQLDDVLSSSDLTLVKNLIEETELWLERAKDSSTTYQERYGVLNQITKSWFEMYNHYKNIPEAIDFIGSIDHLTHYSIAYSSLFLSLNRINEERIGEYKVDLERIVSGFLLLSQIVDVFAVFFSIPELNQVYEGARNAISISARDIKEYFENDLELSILITQLRAYSSLIVLRVDEHIKNTEPTLGADLAQSKPDILRVDEEFEAISDRLADKFRLYAGAAPALSDYAVSRSGIYEEHP